MVRETEREQDRHYESETAISFPTIPSVHEPLHMVISAGPNAIFQASNTRWFFRANIRILISEKHTIKNNINNPYILIPILTVSAYFVEDLIAFER